MIAGKPIYHGGTMTQLELRTKTNRSRARLRWAPEQAAVIPSSMIQYATQRHIDSGCTAPQTCHSGSVVPPRWAA